MADRTRLTAVETVYEEGSWLFTVRDQYGEPDEVILVPCEDGEDGDGTKESGDRDRAKMGGDRDGTKEGSDGDGDGNDVQAWVNRCTHEAQRLDRGFGAAMRDGEIICPKHGSMFDACSGYCDNGEAADTTLVSVDVTVEDGDVFLADHTYDFAHEGNAEEGAGAGGGKNGDDDDDGDVPSSTSHIGL